MIALTIWLLLLSKKVHCNCKHLMDLKMWVSLLWARKISIRFLHYWVYGWTCMFLILKIFLCSGIKLKNKYNWSIYLSSKRKYKKEDLCFLREISQVLCISSDLVSSRCVENNKLFESFHFLLFISIFHWICKSIHLIFLGLIFCRFISISKTSNSGS